MRGGIFVPDETDDELSLAFKNSDFVISKGTGNFEVFKGHGKGTPGLFQHPAGLYYVCSENPG